MYQCNSITAEGRPSHFLEWKLGRLRRFLNVDRGVYQETLREMQHIQRKSSMGVKLAEEGDRRSNGGGEDEDGEGSVVFGNEECELRCSGGSKARSFLPSPFLLFSTFGLELRRRWRAIILIRTDEL
ncbi:uncharacterized protein LOC125218482 [Salvia hispanica]|uniref:uncharacterized protein LOC125218482 n=1 Tax=Salvia hispanica TaxID=49212 RepID=UPI00200923F8|nr:uncharacterized protein LOC125218482 [Salvia hispanica]